MKLQVPDPWYYRKKIIYIGYSKEREEEFRQYWDKEIRDQRKWTRGMNLF